MLVFWPCRFQCPGISPDTDQCSYSITTSGTPCAVHQELSRARDSTPDKADDVQCSAWAIRVSSRINPRDNRNYPAPYRHLTSHRSRCRSHVFRHNRLPHWSLRPVSPVPISARWSAQHGQRPVRLLPHIARLHLRRSNHWQRMRHQH